MINPINKYSFESPVFREGIYSDFDANYLYSVVREYKPKTIIDFAPREGRTTSSIINGIIKNQQEINNKIKYYVFEKDVPYLNGIKKYLNEIISDNNLDNDIEVFYNENILNSQVIYEINNVDLLFVDANHDYILAKWYVENLFKKVKIGGVIHVHDMYYDKNNNGWTDIRFDRLIHTHPDYTDVNTMRNLYPTIFDKYFDGEMCVTKYEPDIVEEFYLKNQDNVEMYSTLQISRDSNQYHEFNCSMYFKIKKGLIC